MENENIKEIEDIKIESINYKIWKKFIRNRLALAGLIILNIMFLGAVLAPLLAPYDPNNIDKNSNGIPLAPSKEHFFGTDNYGRDYFSRALYGSRVSLSVGFIAVFIYVIIGIILGSIAGFFGGFTDSVIMRLVDIMLCLPTFFFILTIQVMLEPSMLNIMIVIGFTSWAGVTRLVRGQFLSIKEELFVQAAKASGASSFRIIWKHILPNTLPPLIVLSTLGIAGAILTESVLSFMGIGIQPPQASWGSMLHDGQEYIRTAPWMAFFPGIFIMITVLGFNFIGDGLRDALDPKSW
jgi:peptide/nickel transport system permease protein